MNANQQDREVERALREMLLYAKHYVEPLLSGRGDVYAQFKAAEERARAAIAKVENKQ